jgi:hypothetical protein
MAGLVKNLLTMGADARIERQRVKYEQCFGELTARHGLLNEAQVRLVALLEELGSVKGQAIESLKHAL